MKRTIWLLVAVFSSSIILILTLASPSLARPQPITAENPPEPPSSNNTFQDIIIYLKETADLTAATLPQEKIARRTEIIQRLQTTATSTQAQLLSYLENGRSAGLVLEYEGLWITNAIIATVQPNLIDYLSRQPEVAHISSNDPIPLLSNQQATAVSIPDQLTWGLNQIRAPHAWNGLGIDGSGVTIAILDTGVDWRHPDLLNNYRGNLPNGSNHVYNWYDSVGYSAVPIDPNGHGTHVAGTAVGSPFIGVAPGAKWIAVRALDANGAGQPGDIHLAFQWLLAPGGNPAKAPDIVNNSWTGGPELTEFMPDVAALKAAGIIPLFAAGNQGPTPGSVGAPANYPDTLAIGASDDFDAVTWFSSRGPSGITNEYKPDFIAPGAHVLSSRPNGSYAYLNGTSMATPHAVGAYALLLSANPSLTSDQITGLITNTAVPIAQTHPNHDSGWGRLDIYNALQSQVTTGLLTGNIQGGGQPIANLTLTITTPSGAQLPFVTGSDGRYQANLLPGNYTITINQFGFQPFQWTNVTVQANQTTNQNVSLTLLPNGTISGVVNELGSGLALSGVIRVINTPVVISTSANGWYNGRLPVGQYELIAAVSGFRLGRATVNITSNGAAIQNFALVPGPKTLLVDAGQVKYDSQALSFMTALEDNDYSFDYWPVQDPNSDAPTLDDLTDYEVVIWSDPVDAPGDIEASQTLSDYLGLGGNLLISGQNIGQKTQDPISSPYWWENQLQGQYLDKADPATTLTADSNSPFAGLTLTLNGPDSAINQLGVDIVRPLPRTLTKAAFQFPDGQAGGLYSDFCGPYHVVYLGFGLEGVSGADNRAAIIERSYGYFAEPEPLAGVQFQPDSISNLVAPGSRLTYTLSLVNRNETMTDTISLNFGGTSWNTHLITPTLTIGPCKRGETTVTIDIPNTLPQDHQESFWLRATSGNVPAIQDDLPFTFSGPGKILLVDDDRWYDRKTIYQAALDEAGVTYDFWEIEPIPGGQGSPPGELLNYYDIILWYTGYDWLQPITDEESQSLYEYLAQGGRLFLSSQDYLSHHLDDPLTQSFFNLRQFTEPLTPTAAFGGPELALWSDLAGPLSLAYGPYQNFSDGIVPGSNSRVSLWHNQGMAAGIYNEGATAGGIPWQLIFWALPFETLPMAHQATAMNQLVGQLSDIGDSTFTADQRVAPASGLGMTRTYTLTLKNQVATQDNQLYMTNTLPAELDIDLATLTGGAIYDAVNHQLSWQGTLSPGQSHTIQYQAAPNQPMPNGKQVDNQVEIFYEYHGLTINRIASYWINAPDLSVSTFQVSQANAFPYETIVFALALNNNGLTATNNASATLRLPDGLGLLTDTLQTTAGTAVIEGRFLNWQGGIGLNQTITVSVMMTTPFNLSPIWLPATAIISDQMTPIIVKDALLFLTPYQSYFPTIAKPE